MKRRKIRLLVSLFLIGLLAACKANPLKIFQAAEPDELEIKIGVIVSRQGGRAVSGQDHLRGYQMAEAEINAQGGILGYPVRVVPMDDESTTLGARDAAQVLIQNENVLLLIGTTSSGSTLEAAGIANAFEVPFIVPTASSDLITQQGYKWVFRINAPSAAYAATALAFIDENWLLLRNQERNVLDMSIIYNESLFGESAAVAAATAAHERWIDITAYESFRAGTDDYGDTLLEAWLWSAYAYGTLDAVGSLDLSSVAPSVLYFAVSGKGAAWMQQCRELNLNPNLYLAHAGAFADSAFIREAGADAEYIIVTAQWSPDVKHKDWPDVEAFTNRFEELYGIVPGMRSAQTYTALWVAVDAIERAMRADECVKCERKRPKEQETCWDASGCDLYYDKAISETPLDWSDPERVGEVREAVRNALRSTDIEQSIFGPIKFDQNGQNNHQVLLVQIIDGQYVTVYPNNYKSRDPVLPVPTWSQRRADE